MNKRTRKKKRGARRAHRALEPDKDQLARYLAAAAIAQRLGFSFDYAMRLYAKGSVDEFWRQIARQVEHRWQECLSGHPISLDNFTEPRPGELIQ